MGSVVKSMVVVVVVGRGAWCSGGQDEGEASKHQAGRQRNKRGENKGRARACVGTPAQIRNTYRNGYCGGVL